MTIDKEGGGNRKLNLSNCIEFVCKNRMTKQSKYVMVYRMDYAMELVKLGHQIISTSPNPRNSNLTAFIFERDKSFTEDFDRILEDGRKSNE